MARPAPSRPPETAMRYMDGIAQHDAIVKELQDRIATLEQALGEQSGTSYRTSPLSTSSSRFQSLPLPELRESPAERPVVVKTVSREMSLEAPEHITLPPVAGLLESNYADIDIASTIARPIPNVLYESASTIAHLCLAHHGEYIGRGSLICALHSITNRSSPRFIYAKSTDSIFQGRGDMERFSPLPYASHTVQQLILKLPNKPTFDALVESYFFNLNWRYGLPQNWFNRAAGEMWSQMQTSPHQSSEINANFLTLVFSILAVAPREDQMAGSSTVLSCDDYFMCAMVSRRIAEDDYFNTPRASTMVSPSDGTVLGCLATPILASFLSERGRVSEAWKLVGSGIRNAQAVGLHRDPGWRLWQVMSQEEKMLRKRAWWSLFITDRFLSYMLGRPHMVRKEIYDVELPNSTNDDGVFDLYGFNQRIMIELAELLGEAMDTCYSVRYPLCSEFLAMDDKLRRWKSSVPTEYQESKEITSLRGYQDPEIFILARQRYILTTWYLAARLKLHIASTTGQHRETQTPADLAKCRQLCIAVAFELIKFQCEFHDDLVQRFKERQNIHYAYLASGWLFHGCFSLFEACVALLATKERIPQQEKVPGVMEAFDRSLEVLSETAKHETGKEGSIATMAIDVLRPLRKQLFSGSQSSGFQGPAGTGSLHDTPLMKSLFDHVDAGLDHWFAGSICGKEVAEEEFVYSEPMGYPVALG